MCALISFFFQAECFPCSKRISFSSVVFYFIIFNENQEQYLVPLTKIICLNNVKSVIISLSWKFW